MQVGQYDVRYMDIMHKLQQSTGTCTCGGKVTCTGPGAQGVDYFCTADGLVKFRDKIHVPDNNDLKKVILREFHAKPYSGHPDYYKTLRSVKKFYYWPNLKRDVAEFVARCLDFQ